MVLARGLIGDKAGVPKVACPLHKKTYSLLTGQNLEGEPLCIKVYSVKIFNDLVYLALPADTGNPDLLKGNIAVTASTDKLIHNP